MLWRKPKPLKQGVTIWLTGLSGAGKSTIARALAQKLRKTYEDRVVVLDGDILRLGLCSDLGYDVYGRMENVRRTAEVANLLRSTGAWVIVALMSPYQEGRDLARQRSSGRFVEVFVDTPLEICRQRDPKGLYALAAAGELRHIPGLDLPYEAPERPEVVLYTESTPVRTCVARIMDAVAALR